jgi:ATP-binding cassette subfamily B protein
MTMQSKKIKDQPLPDYEPLFNENADEIRKKPVKILVGILGSNLAKILLSTLLFLIKNCAVWIIPIITANIINAVTYPGENTAKAMFINAAVLLAIIVQNIPSHVLYSKYTDRTLRSIGAGLRNTLIKKLQHLSLSYHREIESGRIQSKFLRDIEAIEFFNNHFVKSVISGNYRNYSIGRNISFQERRGNYFLRTCNSRKYYCNQPFPLQNERKQLSFPP